MRKAEGGWVGVKNPAVFLKTGGRLFVRVSETKRRKKKRGKGQKKEKITVHRSWYNTTPHPPHSSPFKPTQSHNPLLSSTANPSSHAVLHKERRIVEVLFKAGELPDLFVVCVLILVVVQVYG